MKRILIYSLVCAMLCTATFTDAVFADRGGEGSNSIGIDIGDYIRLGRYYDEPILWRYVSDDENGRLILSDKVICKKSYDEFGGKEKGSHTVQNRDVYSHKESNYWGDSAIRSWLNSKAPAGEVDWLCGNQPGSYRNEKGFLADGNFTQSERMVVKKVKQKSLLDKVDIEYAVGGDAEFWGEVFNIEDFVTNRYDNICYEYTEDMMFLPDIKQLYNIIQNGYVLGDDYFIANITPQAKENDSKLKELLEKVETSSYWQEDINKLLSKTTSPYYLRTSLGYSFTYDLSPFSQAIMPSGNQIIEVADKVGDYGTVDLFHDIVYQNSGIRPAFYLNENNAVILSGIGTEADPYVVTGKSGTENMEDGAIGAAIEENPIGISIFVNGEKTWFPQDPFMENDRIFVPHSWVKTALNHDLYEHDDYMTGYPGKGYFIMHIGSNIITTNTGEQIEWYAAPQKIYGVLYVPLRAFAEALGATVEWVEDEQKVLITM